MIEITNEPPPPPRKGPRIAGRESDNEIVNVITAMAGGAQVHLVRESDNEIVNVITAPNWFMNDAAERQPPGIGEILTRGESS